jgi:hypothetical protein
MTNGKRPPMESLEDKAGAAPELFSIPINFNLENDEW